ncbi:MAG: hypothetical protein RR393_02670 [Bacteroidales bacterium]
MVAVTEGVNRIFIKVAKFDSQGKIVPLTVDEKHNFACYIDAIKFAGVQTDRQTTDRQTTDVISTIEDKIKYNLEVDFNPAIPSTTITTNIQARLNNFKTEIGFDSMIYKQKFIDAVMGGEGEITYELKTFARKGASMSTFADVNIYSELESGYFEYDAVPISIKEIQQS